MKYFILIITLSLITCGPAADPSKPVFNKTLDSFEYFAPVDYFTIQTQRQKLKMAYIDLNPKAEKTALLLHGKNFSGYYYEKIAQELAGRGYRVVIPDQIGFGKSSKPENYQFSFYNLALNTMKLLQSLNIDKTIVVGHSMGGMLATHFTYLYPATVEKLIMINPIGLEPYLKYVQFKDPQFFYKIELKKTPEKFKAYQKKNYFDGKWRPEYDRLLVPYSGQMRGDDWPLIAWNNALTYGPIFTEDITSKFKEITHEVILIIGTRDTTGPGRHFKKEGVTRKLGQYDRLGKKAHAALKNSQLYELKGLGHMPQFEDYEKFSEVFYIHFDGR